MKINIDARKRLEMNILTLHKLARTTRSPAETSGRPLNFVENVLRFVGFAWGVLRGVMGEYNLSSFHV